MRAILATLFAVVLLTGCASEQTEQADVTVDTAEAKKPAVTQDGKYYKDDGPPEEDAVDWRTVPQPQPLFAPIERVYNRPYEVFGVRYVPFDDYTSYRKQGFASWYGSRYHGRKTSSGEIYDMYAMSAAHTVLPIPSYVRVTRVDDGRSIIVRVNDRGPFLQERVIDLSYTAARKLGVVATGTAEVIVEAILPQGVVPKRIVAKPNPVTLAKPKPATEQGSIRKLAIDAGFHLQIGAFSFVDNAQKMADTLLLPDTLAVSTVSVVGNDDLFRVVIGPYADKLAANLDLQRLHDADLEALLKVFE